MAGEIRQTDNALGGCFFQTIRRLKRSEWHIEFNVLPSLAFPSTDVVDIRQRENALLVCTVSFMGLFGQGGVLPYSDTEKLLSFLQKKDKRFAAFFDLFHGRLVQLFYEIWALSRFDIEFERYGHIDCRMPVLSFLQSLNPINEVFYTGILSKRCFSAAMLEQVLADYFQLPIRVDQCIPMCLKLSKEELTQIAFCSGVSTSLAEEDVPNRHGRLKTGDRKGRPCGVNGCLYNELGKNAAIGWRILCVDGRFMISVGPIDYAVFIKLLPGYSMLYSMSERVCNIVGRRFNFVLKILVNSSSIHFIRLQKKALFFLGWNAFLYGKCCLQKVRLVYISKECARNNLDK